MPKFRKKPVVIEAMQWDGNNVEEISQFIDTSCDWHYDKKQQKELVINTLEGDMTADQHDWIIKGVAGEFYPVSCGIEGY